jgi:ABC-type transport system involved in cytochrome c biogenesis permease subunit
VPDVYPEKRRHLDMMAIFALILIVIAVVFQAGFLLRRENRRDPASHWLLAAAAVLLLATLVDRSIRIRFAAVTNTYESLLFFSAALCAVLFVLRVVRRTQGFSPFVLFGATIVALALLAISSSPLAPHAIQPPIPALRSFWLVLHVTFSFIGEAFFVVSFIAALGYFISRTEERRAEMDRLVAAAVGIGYPVFTAGALVFGAIWAETAWGAWWSWDPKETWALITWLIYTAYLHTRLVKRLRGRISAVLALVGFAATLFTFFGVNYLLPGLHSYG